MNYYNEFDSNAAEWLRQLIAMKAIPEGIVDERSITEIDAAELRGFTQCHFFAGIGGWPLALARAGVPADRPLWTGSCPCQPFSCAGKGLAHKDERDLWPTFFGLVKTCHPPRIYGEQVASAEVIGNELEASFAVAVQRGDVAAANRIAHKLARSSSLHYHKRWLDRLRSDLEGEGYTVRNPILGAHSAGADHQRQRLYWVADAEHSIRWGECQEHDHPHRRDGLGRGGNACLPVADAERNAGSADEQGRRPQGRAADCRDCQAAAVADAALGRQRADGAAQRQAGHADGGGEAGRMVNTGLNAGSAVHGQQREDRDAVARQSGEIGAGGVVFAGEQGSQGHAGHGDDRNQPGRVGTLAPRHAAQAGAPRRNFWSAAVAIPCRDGTYRRAEPGIFPLVDGLPRGVVPSCDPRAQGYADATAEARVMRLKGYGNAICVETARMFIESVEEVLK